MEINKFFGNKVNADLKPQGKPEAAKAEEVRTSDIAFKGEKGIDLLKGLEVQGQAQVAKTVHAKDIKACNELAGLLGKDVDVTKVSKYFTPLNVASVSKEVTKADKTIGEALTKGNAEALFESPEFLAFEALFS